MGNTSTEAEDRDTRQAIVDDTPCDLHVSYQVIMDGVYYPSVIDQYIKTGHGFLLVYSIADRNSYDRIVTYQQNILRVKDRSHFPMVVVGVLGGYQPSREVSTAEGQALATSIGYRYVETLLSTNMAHSGDVEEAFFEIVREIRLWIGKCRCAACATKSLQSQNIEGL